MQDITLLSQNICFDKQPTKVRVLEQGSRYQGLIPARYGLYPMVSLRLRKVCNIFEALSDLLKIYLFPSMED